MPSAADTNSLMWACAIRSGLACQASVAAWTSRGHQPSFHAEDRRIELGPALAFVEEFRDVDEGEAVRHRPDFRIDRQVVAVGDDLLAVGQEEIGEQRGSMRSAARCARRRSRSAARSPAADRGSRPARLPASTARPGSRRAVSASGTSPVGTRFASSEWPRRTDMPLAATISRNSLMRLVLAHDGGELHEPVGVARLDREPALPARIDQVLVALRARRRRRSAWCCRRRQ